MSLDVDSAWPSHPCNTVREYLQNAYGKSGQTGHVYAFRGATRHFRRLWAAIDRWEISPQDPLKIETDLLEGFRLRAWNNLTFQERRRCLLAETRWGSKRNTGALVVARHRMVPTRCLDWTYSPLHALLFACEEDEENPPCDGEVWWFNRTEFDHCVAAQWPRLFGKLGHVEDDIEEDFIEQRDRRWFTALDYMLLADDRLDRQKGWITLAGQLGICHAEEVHCLGARDKGRLLIPAQMKAEAIDFLTQMGITRETLGFVQDDSADKIARQIKKEFEQSFLPKR